MLARLDQAPNIAGDSPRGLFRRALLDNPRVTDDMLAAIDDVTLDGLVDPPAINERALARIPDARASVSHRFCAHLLAGVVGLDPDAVSTAIPSLGIMGGANIFLFRVPRRPYLMVGTALHDFTDYLRCAGVRGLNRAVWGAENDVASALIMALGGGRHRRRG